jgi:hypothetical protein
VAAEVAGGGSPAVRSCDLKSVPRPYRRKVAARCAQLRQHWQRAAKLILAQADVMTVSRALELALFHGRQARRVESSGGVKSPGGRGLWLRPGQDLGFVKYKSEVAHHTRFRQRGRSVKPDHCDIFATRGLGKGAAGGERGTGQRWAKSDHDFRAEAFAS